MERDFQWLLSWGSPLRHAHDALSYTFSPGLACSANAPKDAAFSHATREIRAAQAGFSGLVRKRADGGDGVCHVSSVGASGPPRWSKWRYGRGSMALD